MKSTATSTRPRTSSWLCTVEVLFSFVCLFIYLYSKSQADVVIIVTEELIFFYLICALTFSSANFNHTYNQQRQK